MRLKSLFAILLGLQVILASQASSAAEQTGFTRIEKGQNYDVCQAVFKFLRQKNPQRSELARWSFTHAPAPFSLPDWNSEAPSLAIRLLVQRSAYQFKSIEKWQKLLAKYEEVLRSNLQVYKAALDINNDGKKDQVVSLSWFDSRFKGWVYLSYPVDQYNNLHSDFFRNGDFSVVHGELFLFDGRTFSLNNYTSKLIVNEFFTSPMRAEGGLYIKGSVCDIR